jgi:anthranilate phosphoribosyltransferase
MLTQTLNKLVANQDLDVAEAESAMRAIMAGEVSPAQMAAFLVALRMKGETPVEIAAAARVMRSLMTPVDLPPDHLTDIVGTGGDNASTFNVSTAAAFVAAVGGARIAKHGNRSVSSRSGSADLLEAAGAKLDLNPGQVRNAVESLGFGFMFAPAHHGAMKHAAPVRRELGLRTLFNLLGPLTNPAQAPHQVLGVFDRRWLESLARVLGELGSTHVLVVHALDGLDELSIAAPSQIAELKDGSVKSFSIAPEDFGLQRAELSGLRVESPAQSLSLVRRVLGGEPGGASDFVALNAGAALYAADVAGSLADGVARAQSILASGAALQRLDDYVALTQAYA